MNIVNLRPINEQAVSERVADLLRRYWERVDGPAKLSIHLEPELRQGSVEKQVQILAVRSSISRYYRSESRIIPFRAAAVINEISELAK